MHILVLGSAAGGGFPQWNCGCANCAAMRDGALNAQARNQSSIAVSAKGDDWLLINCSPDIRAQILGNRELGPAQGALRGTGIRSVLLVDSQIDHTTGLLMMREGERLELYCTDMVFQDLTTGFPVLNMLEHYCGVRRHVIGLDGESFAATGVPGITVRAVPIESKAPPYSPHRHDPHPGDNIAVVLTDDASGTSVLYAPGLGAPDEQLLAEMRAADCLLVDGTFWTSDEMKRRGVGKKSAEDMGHLPQSGDGGMMETLAPFADKRRVLIHINNTNPILDESSEQRAALTSAGIEVAADGMRIEV